MHAHRQLVGTTPQLSVRRALLKSAHYQKGSITMMSDTTTNRPLRIGFTERGDGGLDLSWAEKLNQVDGVIVVTKNLTGRKTRETILASQQQVPIILHATTTGMGSSVIEPGVPHPSAQLDALAELISAGFPAERIVIRVDPIIPTDECVHAAGSVIAGALARGILPKARLRVSVIDGYRHVAERFRAAGLAPLYGGRWQANDDELSLVASMLEHYLSRCGGTAYACAEPRLSHLCQERGVNLVQQGCLSTQDLELMGIDPARAPHTVNGQRRGGCLCLTCKHELLTRKRQCPHGCLYCYWRN